MELLNGPYLFENMFKDDPELEKLKCIVGVADLLEIYPFLSWLSNVCRC